MKHDAENPFKGQTNEACEAFLNALDDLLKTHLNNLEACAAQFGAPKPLRPDAPEVSSKSLFADSRKANSQVSIVTAMSYTLFASAKRFRPLLCLAACKLFGIEANRALPWAAALEMIHTYSLIHDDLPCMDNDSMRRGQPSNHIAHGEALALLSGDALLTEAFACLLKSSPEEAPQTLRLWLEHLTRAAGAQGMILGQVLDIQADSRTPQAFDLERFHRLKTGALMAACLSGVSALVGPETDVEHWWNFGETLGLAFQIADDILDGDQEEPLSFVTAFGLEAAQTRLQTLSAALNQVLEGYPPERIQMFHDLIRWNLIRKV